MNLPPHLFPARQTRLTSSGIALAERRAGGIIPPDPLGCRGCRSTSAPFSRKGPRRGWVSPALIRGRRRPKLTWFATAPGAVEFFPAAKGFTALACAYGTSRLFTPWRSSLRRGRSPYEGFARSNFPAELGTFEGFGVRPRSRSGPRSGSIRSGVPVQGERGGIGDPPRDPP